MVEALDLLRQDHRNMATLLRMLDQQIGEFRGGGRPDYDVIAGILDYFLSFPDACHHPREDLIFARLRDRDPQAIEAIDDLQSEHRQLAAAARNFLAALRAVLEEAEIPRHAFYERARRFIDRQRLHIGMEESTFFPAAERALTPADWTELEALMPKTDVGERFEPLRQMILRWQRDDEAAAAQKSGVP